MGFFNFYKKSHQNDPILNSLAKMIDIDTLADSIVTENYGCHRMICALAEAEERKFPGSKLAKALKEAAEQFTT